MKKFSFELITPEHPIEAYIVIDGMSFTLTKDELKFLTSFFCNISPLMIGKEDEKI